MYVLPGCRSHVSTLISLLYVPTQQSVLRRDVISIRTFGQETAYHPDLLRMSAGKTTGSIVLEHRKMLDWQLGSLDLALWVMTSSLIFGLLQVACWLISHRSVVQNLAIASLVDCNLNASHIVELMVMMDGPSNNGGSGSSSDERLIIHCQAENAIWYEGPILSILRSNNLKKLELTLDASLWQL